MRASQHSPKCWITLLSHLECAYVQCGIPLGETDRNIRRGGMMCGDKKRLFQSTWDAYKYRAANDNFAAHTTARHQYKNECRYHRARYVTQRVNNLRTNPHPKQFWEGPNGGSMRSAKMLNSSDEEFFNHFAKLIGTRPQADTSFD